MICSDRPIRSGRVGLRTSDWWLTSAIALNLHSFYTGAERIFEQVAKESDGYLPTGANWHENLLFADGETANGDQKGSN